MDSETHTTARGQLKATDTPFKITLAYIGVGALWVLFSDQLLAALVSDPVTLTRLGTIKGWFYVTITAGFLFVLIQRADEAQRANEAQHRQRLEQRVADRTRALATLLDVSHNVTSTLELELLLDLILEQLKQVVDYAGASIVKLEGQQLMLQAYHGPTPWDRMPQQGGVAEWAHLHAVVQSEEPVVIADVEGDDPLALALRELSSTVAEPFYGYIASWMGAPLMAEGHVIGLLILHHAEPNFYTAEDADLVMAFANQAAVALRNAELHEQAQRLAVLEERQRLARELHDSVTQALYSVTLHAQAAGMAMSAGKPDAVIENLQDLRSMAREAMIDMRMLLFELHPPKLEQEGLAAALRTRLAAVETRAGLQTEMHVERDRRLPLATEEGVFWICQEALNNVVKHAGADAVIVRLQFDDDNVYLEVQDDGVGFDPTQAEQSGGMGLRSMTERVQHINGDLEIDSAPGQGTTVRVTARDL